jgi:phosphohistidine swiveling domain-containing protein
LSKKGVMFDMILHFDQVEEVDYDQAGGKGYTLARLRRAGFPVPSGFIVTTDAYRAFATSNGLVPHVADTLADDDPAAASARIWADFEEAEMPPALAAAIRDAYLAFGEGEVAVRSSALAEDDEAASFAGQYETILGIVGCDALIAAVRRCWASLWSERALAYRGCLGFEGDEVAMAVVVQEMVPTAQAGVAFTLDPVSGRRGMVVVEAVAGKGDALVGGQAAPHRYVIPKGTDNRHAGDDLLTGEHLAAVVALAAAVEVWAGAPQDVEWALDEVGRLHLLQARPITALGPRGSVWWTRDNVGEVVPEPMTPLSWSVLEPLSNGAFAEALHRLGVGEVSSSRLFDRFYGRVYFNQTLFQEVIGRYYLSYSGWRGLLRLVRVFLHLFRLPREAARLITSVRTASTPRLDPAVEMLLSEVEVWRRRETMVMEIHHIAGVIGTLLCQTLEKVVGRGATAALLVGSSGVRSAKTGEALTFLARQVATNETLRERVLVTPPQQLAQLLAEMEAGRAVLAGLQCFLDEYGHRASQEFELAEPRWRDDPVPVLMALQAQVRVLGADGAGGGRAREGGRPDMFPRLHPWTLLAREARRFAALRENLKDAFVLTHDHMRRLYLALGEVMTCAGVLGEATAVFFLTHEEIVEWSIGWLSAEEAQTRAAARQGEWERMWRRSAPFALEQKPSGRLVPQERTLPSWDGEAQVLQGVPVSPGTFAGHARVARTSAEAAALEPGEVLVASAVTPGWAPLLWAAGGLVTEIGGVLSHGAIIAREYDLPAVLNIADATRLIRTGQLVHIDGLQGVVRIME